MKRACTNNQTCWYHGLPNRQHWSNKRLLFGSLGLWHFVIITSAKTVCYLYFKSTRNRKLLPTAKFLFVALAKNLSKGNFEIRVVTVFSRVFPLPQFSLSLFPKWLSSNFWYPSIFLIRQPLAQQIRKQQQTQANLTVHTQKRVTDINTDIALKISQGFYTHCTQTHLMLKKPSFELDNIIAHILQIKNQSI